MRRGLRSLEGLDVDHSIRSHVGFCLADGVCMHAATKPRDPEEWPGRGAALLTLHVGLWALTHAANFREGLTMVAEIGGDTDTYGAVAGGLLGARFGIEGIPSEWREVLMGHDVMVSLADQLYDLAHE